MARRSKYPQELMDRGVRLALESGRPVAQVARDLGIGHEALRKRVRQAEADGGLRPDLPTQRGARGDQAAQARELRAAARERDPEGRLSVFRDGARRRPSEVSAFIDRASRALRRRADLPDPRRVGVRLLPARDRRAL